MSRPRVSIILPTYNRAHSISKAIYSILEQTFTDFELIIVDDGSSDQTKNIVKAFTDPRVSYIEHGHNKGVSAARNTGISLAKGNFIAFQDSDDKWYPTKLEKQIKTFSQASPKLGVVYVSTLKIYQHNEILLPDPKLKPKSGNVLNKLLISNLFPIPAALIKKQCFKEAGTFDEKLATQEDWELCIRIAQKYHFAHINEPLVESPFSSSGVNNANIQNIIGAINYIKEKHYSSFKNSQGSLANLEYFLGCKACHQNSWQLGRRYLMSSIRMQPLRIKYWAAILLSYISKQLFQKFVKFGR